MEHGLVRGSLRRAAAPLLGVGIEEGFYFLCIPHPDQCDPWEVYFVAPKVWGTLILGLHRLDGSPDKRLQSQAGEEG